MSFVEHFEIGAVGYIHLGMIIGKEIQIRVMEVLSEEPENSANVFLSI